MSGGEIAGLIAASALALFVIFLAVPLLNLGKLLDETTDTVKEINDSLPSLLTGLTETVDQTNKQLAKIDVITDNVADVYLSHGDAVNAQVVTVVAAIN